MPVVFNEKEASALRSSFLTGLSDSKVQGGRMLITPKEASVIGKRLAKVLFPKEVFRLFATSLAFVAQGAGLRIRLSMDPSLLDLPWEYVSRPDRRGNGAGHVSDFLMLDPSISMVRQVADASIALSPITGRQRLAFVGTFWEGKRDMWEVGKEFVLLSEALAPVASYVRPDFVAASDAIEREKGSGVLAPIRYQTKTPDPLFSPERERESFRRAQIDRLVSSALEAAVHLHTQYDASHNVAWLAANAEPPLATQAFQSIEQIRFALASLVAMGVVPQQKLVDADRLLSSLRLDWHTFSSTRAAYRDALSAGTIKMSGQASEKARAIEERYLESAKQYGGHLKSLRELTASIHGAVGGASAAQPSAAGDAPQAARP